MTSLEPENTTQENSKTFEDFSFLPKAIYESLQAQGINEPTHIQKMAIKPTLEGHDLLAQSQTGSGKTLAFALPVGLRLEAPSDHGTPRVLVLTPTRELAAQVKSVFSKTLSPLGLRCLTIMGGESYTQQRNALRRGVDIVVGTPGRIADLIRQKTLKLDFIDFFVLDEVDQMLDIGFAEELSEVNDALPKKVQTLFFSATINKRMEALARKLLTNPVELKIAPQLTSPSSIDHGYFPIKSGKEIPALLNILLFEAPPQALIFCETKKDCREVTEAIESRGFNAAALNGDLSQEVRIATFNRFRKGSLQYLIATNVAARGLDIQGLPLVINFDVPFDVESYTHRTGRTGRAGEHGKAWSLVTPRNIRRYWYQMKDLGLNPERLKIPSQVDILASVTKNELAHLNSQLDKTVPRAIRRIADKVMEDITPEDAHALLREYLHQKLTTTSAFKANEIEAEEMDFRSDRSRSHARPNRKPQDRKEFRPRQNKGQKHQMSTFKKRPAQKSKKG